MQLEMFLAIVMKQLIVHHMMELIFHLPVLEKEDQLVKLENEKKNKIFEIIINTKPTS
jgi:hypothetical protein